MDVDTESILNLMFPEGISDTWIDNPDFNNYLSKLSVYNLEKLCKEPDHLEVEKVSVLNQTQELAFANYKTFIKTAECSRELFQQFQKTEAGLDSLISRLPDFTAGCENLLRRYSSLEIERQASSIALKRHSDLLQVLELPQLLESAVRSGLVEESLLLIAFVQRFAKSHPNIPVLQNIAADIEKWSIVLRSRLLSELKGELSLPRCLVDIGVLRRMGALTEPELRLVFLQARGYHLSSLLSATNENQNTITKRIEIYRSQLFNIITQYKGVFPESSVLPGKQQQSPLLEEWVSNKINEFLSGAEHWTSEGGSIEGVMYLGQSLGRVGCDIRGLAIPHFLSGMVNQLRTILESALAEFPGDMDKAALSSIHEDLCGSNIPFYPLARLTNGILSSFNSLRHGAPLALAHPLTNLVEETLAAAAQQIANFHTREQQALGQAELEVLYKLALCFSDQMIPYVQNCLHTVYPPAEIALFLSLSVYKLQSQGVTYMNTEKILEPVKHLLLPRLDHSLSEENKQLPSFSPATVLS